MAQPFHEDFYCVATCRNRGGWRRVAALPLHSVHQTFAITRRGSGCFLPLHPSRMSAELDVNIGLWLYLKFTTKNCFFWGGGRFFFVWSAKVWTCVHAPHQHVVGFHLFLGMLNWWILCRWSLGKGLMR